MLFAVFNAQVIRLVAYTTLYMVLSSGRQILAAKDDAGSIDALVTCGFTCWLGPVDGVTGKQWTPIDILHLFVLGMRSEDVIGGCIGLPALKLRVPMGVRAKTWDG